MEEQPIHEETTSYKVLLYRKNRALRLWEIGVFLVGLFGAAPYFEFRSPGFVAVLVLLGVAVMGLVPALYRVIYRPRYILYPRELVIHFGGRRNTYALTQVKPAYDMPYVYRIQDRKISLLVSDAFIESLETRRQMIERGLDSHDR
ncbi:hypothetical protein [Paludifilum halophilum]|uniref:Uncharacterized protein n=1 Tax=Paludifilum halophilum TaxID=1642702 RepID=A0A235B3G5_9BACL|nr:hypothetical protein [Paludifilum halophilum]OYD06781.1 hypothetical protein CHM34_14600 [Paludifilum halophilum]